MDAVKTTSKKTRCSGTMTEAAFRGWILSALRSLSRKWKPANDAWKLNTRIKPKDVPGRHRTEHKCAQCGVWLPRKTKQNARGIELDHITPIGGLSSLDKLKQWVQRAFVEIDGFQKLCSDKCHAAKTAKERSEK